MAEISASVAQADPLASASVALTKHSSMADAQPRKIRFIAIALNFDGPGGRESRFASFQKDPRAAKKLGCNKLQCFEFPFRNLAGSGDAPVKRSGFHPDRALRDGNCGLRRAGSLPGPSLAAISRCAQTGAGTVNEPLPHDLYRRGCPEPGRQG